MKKHLRLTIQILFTALTNGYLYGFIKGHIYQGKSKMICVPGLNCYSCPSATGACPIGSLQSVLSGSEKHVSYYVTGFLILFGALFGRFICGFLCPFGLIQDLLHKIKVPKVTVPKKVDKPLRYLKFVVLIFFVILFPLVLVNEFGIGTPTFCKYICPSGTLFGGIPLVLSNPSLQNAIGFLFDWKIMILVIILLLSTMIYRPFCKYLCPLGAFYGLFNRISFVNMHVDFTSCTNCKTCEKQCKMQVEITKNINAIECIRCGECKTACPHNCIHSHIC